ncbi:hypothetical protein DW944_09980 [Eubacterium ventriosum]|jgi:hypothetical protein|uniref:Uncharacterized protein n=1 Tax=Eubacterium ventriosum TaxID=39496 RepID=A0A413R5X3_9FIRM|nr:hypothetical protein [Eubacterium ventriosum]RHA17249.1 hypothetical protein DW944_09980 [Eubacterium ventriosum]RHB18886.1 hypothetical protein DW893_02645 [Eubacterium ventriosum]
MANRPVYHSITKAPYYEAIDVTFKFYSGFSVAQKQKSIQSLHKQYSMLYPDHAILEISSKSTSKLGVSLSAFNLNIKTKSSIFSVECAFQSSKVFENGGPYTDLLQKSSREAKRDPRLRESGKLISFQCFNMLFPLEPKDYFYNWLYVNTLNQNKDLAKEIVKYDSFSDIEFNPQKSINCQAKAAAIFVSLYKQNLLTKALESRAKFLEVVYGVPYIDNYEQLTFFEH